MCLHKNRIALEKSFIQAYKHGMKRQVMILAGG